MDKIIELNNVSFDYPDVAGKGYLPVFKDFTLTVGQGETVAIMGKSGRGKSTLLRLIASLEEPSGGDILYNGKNYHTFEPTEIRKKISLVAQIPVMLEGSVKYNLELGLDSGIDGAELEDWLQRFDLGSVDLDKPAGSLSVGQKQRVAVIRNLLVNPRVLLLDEPTSGLDAQTALLLTNMVREIAAGRGMTTVWSSHDMSVASFAERTVEIKGIS